MKLHNLKVIQRYLIIRTKRIKRHWLLLLLSTVIGVGAGIAAWLLKSLVYLIKSALTNNFSSDDLIFLYIFFPMIGVLLTILFLKYIIRDHVKHGIPRILYVISRNRGKMRKHKTFSSMVGGSLTAGFGGSIGLESPIISTGSSIGSSIGQYLKLDYKTTTLLIGCGAAGAIASIFTTPVAAVIFSLEVLMLDLTISSIIPLLAASASGAITTKILLSERIILNFDLQDAFVASDVPFYILLGVVTGLMSLYFNKVTFSLHARMLKIKNQWVKAVIGMSILGGLIFIFPPLYGEGYENIKLIIEGQAEQMMNNSPFYDFRSNMYVFGIFILGFLLLKVVATSLTVESGGIGGIFAPSAITGGISGFLFARIINDFGIFRPLSEANFTLVGMAGVLGAVLHAPLTAIFLVAEITNGYELIVPLMICTTISFLTIKVFDKHSIFNRQLAERGHLLTHHKDKTVLTLLNVKEVIDTDLNTIAPDATLGELTKVISKSRRNIYPVIDADSNFLGLVALDDVREDMFKPELYKNSIQPYIIQPMDSISTTDTMENVMEKFKSTSYYNLPVIDKGKYVGFVSRSNLFGAYRKVLLDVSFD